MDKTILKVAEILNNSPSSSSDLGIINGYMGDCIFLYALSRKTNSLNYEWMADELLDKIYSNLSTSLSADFENGLAGIGYGIEFLVQNNYIQGNTDEILEEIDNNIYKILIEEEINSLEFTNGLTGYLFYLVNRLKFKREPLSGAYKINRELYVHTINKIDELLPQQISMLVKDIHFDLFWRFPLLLFCLSEAYKLQIYDQKIKFMLKQWICYLEAYIPSLHSSRLFMAIAIKRIILFLPDERLEKQLNILLYTINIDILKTEINHKIVNLRFGWLGILFLLKLAINELGPNSLKYDQIIKTYSEVLESKIGQLNELNLCFRNAPENGQRNGLGLIGIGLMELIWPQAFQSKGLMKEL